MAWNLHAIATPSSRHSHRDGVASMAWRRRDILILHTASNSRWCRFFSSIFSYFSFRLPPAMVAAMVARAEAAQVAALSHARELYCQRFPGFRAVRSTYFEVRRPSPARPASSAPLKCGPLRGSVEPLTVPPLAQRAARMPQCVVITTPRGAGARRRARGAGSPHRAALVMSAAADAALRAAARDRQ